MSRVRSYDTAPERALRTALHAKGLRFRKHVADVAGRPDVVFVSARVAVFVDGDFWHGYRFPAWQAKLLPYWRNKIARNRQRDRRNFAKLRRHGWRVIRIWEHSIQADLRACVSRVASVVKKQAMSKRRHRRAS
jgi:DNA mismatch endonuclease (patch repair protein)